MAPYRLTSTPRAVALLLLCSLVDAPINGVAATSAGRTPHAQHARTSSAPAAPDSVNAAEIKELSRAGHEHYYSMEYEDAERDFARMVELDPANAAAVNHLLTTVLFSELNRAGALNTSLYASDKFLALRKPANVPAAARARIEKLDEQALALSNRRLAANPNDETALYNRGVTKGLFATYQALVEHSWFAALRGAVAARRDHQRVLELDPKNNDAKTIVGMHTYIAGSLPWAVKGAVAMVGFTGNKERGLKLLREAAEAGGESSIDAKVALALFLRREQRYEGSLQVVRSITAAYPRNFLFALEEANLLKDMGRNQEALDSFQRLVDEAKQGRFHAPRTEYADYGLGEMLRGRRQFAEAAAAFEEALKQPQLDPDIRQRCALAAGEMYDAMNQRTLALQDYQLALAGDTTTPTADLARKHLREPYRAQ